MDWMWIVLVVLAIVAICLATAWISFFHYLKVRFGEKIVRIFQEKPLFIIPRGQPVDDAEEVRFPTTNGLSLTGCYFPTTLEKRRGVILFGLEFGSDRWSCVPYTQFLRDAGYDIFTYEPRCQGSSDRAPNYDPLQWVTDFDAQDMQAAIAYLKSRPDADPKGIGLFGISKGGSTGLLVGANEPYIRCFVTDGMFATLTTMLPYMRRWVTIYSQNQRVQNLVPDWYYGMFGKWGLRKISDQLGCEFPHLERYMHRLYPRPLFMIHGGADNYIKPEMARALFARVRGNKELWIVDKAKHNQAFHIAHEEYKERVLAFFLEHLDSSPATFPSNGISGRQEIYQAPVTA